MASLTTETERKQRSTAAGILEPKTTTAQALLGLGWRWLLLWLDAGCGALGKAFIDCDHPRGVR
jgi:hypothetical protein